MDIIITPSCGSHNNRTCQRMPRIIQTNWLIGISGIVLWPYVFVIRLDEKLLRHEYIHVMQIRRSQRKYGKMGVIFWYFSYLWEWVKVGFNYWKIRYEVEAFGNEENDKYIQMHDPELWEDIRHHFDNLQN